jgi:cell division septal protein FtsQ
MAKKKTTRKTYKIIKKKPIYRLRIFWFAVFSILVAGLAGYFIIFFHYFWVSSINVIGTQRINNGEIADKISQKADNRVVFPTRSIFLFSVADAEKNISSQYPAIEKISILKKIPNALEVSIRERSAVALWVNSEKYYSIDRFGIVFSEADTNNRLVIRSKQGDVLFNFGDQVVKESLMAEIIKIDQLIKRDSGISVREVVVDDNRQITAETDTGFAVYFDTANDINWQLEKLRAVLEKQIPVEKRSELEYVDVRFGNLAPYRYRSASD